MQTLHFLPRGSGSPRADRQKTLGWGKRMQDPVLCRPKPTPRPNEHVRARTEEERRAGFAHPCGEPSSPPPLLLCAQVPDGLFSTAAFFSLNEGVVPAAWSVSEACSPATVGESISRRARHSEGPAARARGGGRVHGHRGQSPARGEPLPRARTSEQCSLEISFCTRRGLSKSPRGALPCLSKTPLTPMVPKF